MTLDAFSHSILQYIIDNELAEHEVEAAKLPSLGQLAKELGVSRGKLREDMIAAQAYGVIEMRPGDGTYVKPFDFYEAIRPLVLYGIAYDKQNFDRYYRLRAQIEISFWEEAVSALGRTEYEKLEHILDSAEHKLGGRPIEIPHKEHRDFHVLIFSRLDNPFAQGLLKAYWDAYEAVGLHRYFEFSYYEQMWSSHRAMVRAIQDGRIQEGKQVLIKHMTPLEDRLQDGHHRQRT
jgi:GntR family transcriptional repressor for pyruvate dehydrogenase complex